MGLRGKIVDLIGLDLSHHMAERGAVGQVAVFQMEGLVGIDNVIDTGT